MNHILTTLNSIRRPRLLIQAARIGAADYRRDIHLRRLTGPGRLPKSGEALIQLMESEANLDDLRRSGDATYSVADHLDILIAMMGEVRVLRAAHPETLK